MVSFLRGGDVALRVALADLADNVVTVAVRGCACDFVFDRNATQDQWRPYGLQARTKES